MPLTSKERLWRIFKNQEYDRPSLKLWGSWKCTGDLSNIAAEYREVAMLASETTDLFGGVGSPFNIYYGKSDKMPVTGEVKPTDSPLWNDHITTYHTSRGDLRTIYRASTIGEPGYTVEYAVKEEADLEKLLSMPYEPYPFSCDYENALETMGDSGIVTVNIDHAAYALQRMTGSENLALFSVDCRETVHELISAYSERLQTHVKQFFDNGIIAPVAYVGPELLTPPLMNERDYMDFVYRYDKPLCDIIHNAGGYVWMHCHGKVARLLDNFIDMGIDIINPLEPPKNGDVDMLEIAEKYRGRIGLEGNIEIQDILLSSPEELREKIRTCVDAGSRSGRFILCPSAGFMEYVFPTPHYIENLKLYLTYGMECVTKAQGCGDAVTF